MNLRANTHFIIQINTPNYLLLQRKNCLDFDL